MTECIDKRMSFSSVAGREVVADFLGGRLTSDAGILLLKEVDRQIGLIDAINEAIPDPRDPLMTVHDQRTMLAQRIFSIALGYEDLNDQQSMRTDAALQVAAGVAPVEAEPMASPSTLCRLENRVLRRTCVRLSKILVDQFIASYQTPPEEITLDFDAPFMVSRKVASFMATIGATASCHFTFSAAASHCWHTSGRAKSTEPNMPKRSPNCWSSICVRLGRRLRSQSVATVASLVGNCCVGAKNTTFRTVSELAATKCLSVTQRL